MTIEQKRGVSAMLTLMFVCLASGTILRTYLPGEPIIATLETCADIPMSVYGFDKQTLYSELGGT